MDPNNQHQIIDDLLSEWDDRVARGENFTVEELCVEHPELLGEVQRQIKALEVFALRFGNECDDDYASSKQATNHCEIELPVRAIRIESEYQLERLHGIGGLGSVYLAHDPQLNRRVAIKFPRGKHHSALSRLRFEREARITSRLDHPGIVPVHVIHTDTKGQPCYAMRFIEGDTLQVAIDRLHKVDLGYSRQKTDLFRSPEFRDLLRRFQAVCDIAAYGHSQNVIHRDIKPSNIMLGPFGETLLVDWGLAKVMKQADDLLTLAIAEEELATSGNVTTSGMTSTGDGAINPTATGITATRTGQIIGTPAFASPEQLMGQTEHVCDRSDIFSLGATLYSLLTGEHLMHSCELPEHLQKMQSNRLPHPRLRKASVPLPLDAICIKALSIRPEDRYGSAQDLSRDIDNYLRDEPISVPCETVYRRAMRWLRKHPKSTSGIVASLIVGFTAAVASTFLLNQKNFQLDDANLSLANSNQKLQSAVLDAAGSRDHAVAALRSLSDEVLASFLQQNKSLTVRQTDYLQRVLTHYQKFADSQGDSPDWLLLKTEGLVQCGAIHLALRDVAAAEERLKESIALLGQLAETSNGVDVPLRQVAAHLKLADCYSIQRKFDQVTTVLNSCTDIIQNRLLVSYENVHESRLAHAQTLHRQARNEFQLGHHSEGLAITEKAQTLLDEIISSGHSDPEVIRILATLNGDVEKSLYEHHHIRVSAKSAGKSLEQWMSLLIEFPSDPDCLNGAAKAEAMIALAYAEERQHRKVIEACSRGIEHVEKAAADYPLIPAYRQTLSHLLQVRGAAKRQLNDSKGGVADLNLSFELARSLPTENFGDPRDQMQSFWIRIKMIRSQLEIGDRVELDKLSSQLVSDIRGALDNSDERILPSMRNRLGLALLTHAGILIFREKIPEATDRLHECVEIFAEQIKTTDGVKQCGDNLMDAHRMLAAVFQKRGDDKQSEIHLQLARDIAEKLWPTGPTDMHSLDALALLEMSTATHFDKRGLEQKAESAYRKEIEWRVRFLELSPESNQVRTLLAGARCNLANTLQVQQRYDEAIVEYDLAIGILTQSLTEGWKEPVTDAFLRNCRMGRASTLRFQSKFQEALAEFDVLRNEAPHQFNALLRTNRILCLARLNPSEAVAEGKGIQPSATDPTFRRFILAAAFAIAAEHTDDAAVKADAVAQAMLQLKTLESEGGFKSAFSKMKFNSSPDFNSLREVPEFHELVDRLNETPGN